MKSTATEYAFLRAAADLATELVKDYPTPINTEVALQDIMRFMQLARAYVEQVSQARADLRAGRPAWGVRRRIDPKSPEERRAYQREYNKRWYAKNKGKQGNKTNKHLVVK